jgi:CRP-like cAMP-binding protein
MTLVDNEERSATARCLTDVHAVIVTQAQREKMMSEVPQWLQVLLKELSTNLRNLNEKYVQVKAKHDILEKRLRIHQAKEDAAEDKSEEES